MAGIGRQLFWVSALGVSLGACSLLFESSSGTDDAGVVDAGIVVDARGAADAESADARETDRTSCGVPLTGTLGYFSLDDQGGNTTISNTASAIVADSVTKPDAGLVPVGLDVLPRDTEKCGDAASLSGLSGSFLRIGPAEFKQAQSIDFWFRTANVDNNGLGGLLTADGNGSLSGDFGVFIFKTDQPIWDDAGTDTHHVLLRLQDGNGAIYFRCSDPVPLGVWNHVAVSLDGIDGGAKLFVNGADTQNLIAVVPGASTLGSNVCGAGQGARVATLESNTRPWLWGASNTGGPEDPALDGITGQIDELRFRSEPFTEVEASLVYGSLSAP